MKKLSKNEMGFGAIEVILLLVTVIAIAAVGYYVYKAKQNTISTYNTSASTTIATTDTSTKWTRVSSFNNKFSLLIPDGWKINVSQVRDSIYVSDDISGGTDELKVIDNTKPTITKGDITRGGILPFSAVLEDKAASSTPAGTASVEGSVSGMQVTRYEEHPTESLPDQAQPGDTEYFYQFGSSAFFVDYIQRKGVESHLTDIEKVVKSVQLNL